MRVKDGAASLCSGSISITVAGYPGLTESQRPNGKLMHDWNWWFCLIYQTVLAKG